MVLYLAGGGGCHHHGPWTGHHHRVAGGPRQPGHQGGGGAGGRGQAHLSPGGQRQPEDTLISTKHLIFLLKASTTLPSSVFPVKVSGPPLDLQTGLELLQHPAQTVHLVPAVHGHPQGGQVVSVGGGEGVGQCCLRRAMKVREDFTITEPRRPLRGHSPG